MNEEESNEQTKQSSSAKYGRRAMGNGCATWEANSENVDSTQEELEKYWRSLQGFRQCHKGRLDSANNEDGDLFRMGERLS